MTSRVFLFTLGAAFSAASLSGQTSQERGKRAIDAALTALGGDRFLAMQNRVETGRAYSFYQERLSGLSRAAIYTRYSTPPTSAAPGSLHVSERQDFGKEGRDGSALFTPEDGYTITFRGARPLSKERLDRYRETTLHNIFYILRVRHAEPGMIFEFQGTDIIDNRPVELVNVTDSENRVTTVYLDRSTHLPARQVWFRRDPKTRARLEEVTIFSKYRDVGGGVLWPFDVQRLRDGEKIFQIYCESVAIDQRLDEGLFNLPTRIKILAREK